MVTLINFIIYGSAISLWTLLICISHSEYLCKEIAAFCKGRAKTLGELRRFRKINWDNAREEMGL